MNWTTQIDNVRIEGTQLSSESGDQTALIALYDEIKALNLSDYTDASKAVVNRALAAAEAIFNTEATQAKVDHTFNMLTVAKDSLTSEPNNAPVMSNRLRLNRSPHLSGIELSGVAPICHPLPG